MKNLTARQRNIFFGMLGAVFLLSLSYSFYFRIPPAVDARAYDTIAWHLVQGYGYREWLEIPLNNDNAIIRVGPGYEFFLAGLYFLFGHHYEIVWVAQAFLLMLMALLTFLTAREVFSNSFLENMEVGCSSRAWLIGVVAAFLVGFSPDLITMQGMLMTETLGIFLVVLSVYLFFNALNRELEPRSEKIWGVGAAAESAMQEGGKIFKERGEGFSWWYKWALVALVLALATLVRTPSILLALPMGGYLFWHKQWRAIVFMTLVGVLVFAPWTVRNYRVFGEFIPTNLASGFNLLAGNRPGANGEQEPYPILDKYVKKYGYVEANRRASSDALSFITSHPLEYIKLTLLRASIYFSFARPTGFWFHLSGFSKITALVASSIYAFILFTFGFWGIAVFLKEYFKRNTTTPQRDNDRALLLFGMLLMMPLAIIPIIVETRYRMPVYPFFALFAGFGFQKLREKQKCLTCFALVVFLVFANTAFDVIYNLDRIIERISGI